MAVIIPALNEAAAIGYVLRAIPAWVSDIIVVDNGSADGTAEVARNCGVRVIIEPRRGYGSACLAGIAALRDPEVVVFLDADFSDRPEELAGVVRPIIGCEADLVIGSRVLGERESGALTPQQRCGNWIACKALRWLYGALYTDLGPFRAIRYTSLRRLNLDDITYGWTIQMQARAAKMGLRGMEVPVSYRRRIGKSKISGTIRGVLGAGAKILYTLAREWFRPAHPGGWHLAVFTRFPEPGRAKTRLIPALGAEAAAQVQQRMTAHTLAQVRRWRDGQSAASPIVRFAGGDEQLMRGLYGADLSFVPQGEGDLGQRMLRAVQDGISAGADRVVLIGTDCPQLSADILRQAFAALERHDVVLGPAADGGYYLIGVRTAWGELFDGIDWGTETVLADTLQRARRLGLSVAQLGTLQDVDRPEDLTIWYNTSRPQAGDPSISVVIPALNEETMIAEAICSALAPGVEVIVVDGGSTDRTVQIAESYVAIVLHSRKGRACQMNAGAAAARGKTLLFLHADSRLPTHYEQVVTRTLALSGVAAGAFPLQVVPSGPAMQVIAATTNLRSRCFEVPYGDQAIFISRERFRQVGGFPDIPVMEDLVFVRQIKRWGRIQLAEALVTTSGRRWQAHGAWRMTLLNQALIVAYCLGCPPSLLLRWRESGRLWLPALASQDRFHAEA